MVALIMSLVVALMILALLVPDSIQNVMMWNVPKLARPDPQRWGMRIVPSVTIFAFGLFMFQGWDRYLMRTSPRLSDPFQAKLAIGAGIFFLAIGVFGCIWPLLFMERSVSQLRGKIAELEPRAVKTVLLVGKGFGVICLLTSAYLLHRSLG